MRQVINQVVLQRIKEDEELILYIARSVGKKFRTVYQWVLDNDPMLTVPAVLQIIKDRFSLTDSQILESSSVPSL